MNPFRPPVSEGASGQALVDDPTTTRTQQQHELKFPGPLLGLVTGERTLTMVTESVMRNE